MKRLFAAGVSLLLLYLSVTSTNAKSSVAWFQQRVNWQAGKEALPWEVAVASPDGKQHYRLALVPLWAVEGGIVAIEIVVARPEHPNVNLLGERKDIPQPFVITVEELEAGISKSQFGATRVFRVGRAKLQVEIKGTRLGPGLGECQNCIQEFSAQILFGT